MDIQSGFEESDSVHNHSMQVIDAFSIDRELPTRLDEEPKNFTVVTEGQGAMGYPITYPSS